VVKLVDTHGLGPCAVRHGGSSPLSPTREFSPPEADPPSAEIYECRLAILSATKLIYNMNNKKIHILSLGGSLIVPGERIDKKFLKSFRALVVEEIKKGRRFVIITGGGGIARIYQYAWPGLSKDERDWIGIQATRLNAYLVRAIFDRLAYPEIVISPEDNGQLIKWQKSKYPVLLAGGWKPGWSTDYVAVLLAKKFGTSAMVNLSNIDHAYDKDPKKYPGAKKFESVGWPEFLKIVGKKWQPGLNLPLDPIASRFAAKSGLEVIIMNGRKLANLKNYLAGRKFNGTVIK
jgi:uridylate kinase